MMMKKYGLITKVLLISMFAILLNGCENSLTSEFSSKANEAKFYTITGNIDVDAISAENSSRTGLPTIPSIDDNSINFSVSATKGDETIDGKVDGNQYSITLPKGSWTITVIGKKDNNVEVLRGDITVNPEEPTTQQTITLKTINAGTGTGSLSLTIKDATLSCGGVKAALYNNSFGIGNEEHLTFTTTNNSTKWDVKDLNAGTYEIKLDFYQKMNSSADGTYSWENLLYSHHDTVNIFANLVTNTWTGSGYSEDKTTFTLTQAMIDNFAMSTFYVSNSGDDSNAGTYFAPFATLQAAVNKVIEMNNVSPSNENAPYRILLLSDVTDTSTGEDIDTNDGSLISIKNYSNPGLYLKIASYQNDSCFEIKGASGRRIMNIEEGANVTIENITLTGGNINDNNGGGVYVAYNAIFTMGNGATISNCTGYNGGGVYVQSGTFNMNGGTISDCIAEQGGGVYVLGGTFTMYGGIIGKEIKENDLSKIHSWEYAADADNHSNYASNGGGGIYVASGNVTINGGKISYNYVPNPGNDCQGKTPENTAAGGGISIEKGSLSLTNSEVSYNSGYQGGGIRCYNNNTSNAGTLTLNETLIKGNTSNPYKGSSFGGGLMVKNFNVTFEGTTSSTIEQNYSGDGGALFLENTTSTLENITIQNNSYNSNGYHYGSEVLLWAKANVSIGSSDVTIKSADGETRGVFMNYDVNNPNTLNLSGGAKLDAPVYLKSGTSVTVAGNLTSEGTVATITPQYYPGDTMYDDKGNATGIAVDVSVLTVGTDVTLNDIVGKFAVTPSSGTSWTIDSEGKLLKVDCYYVKSDSTNNGNGNGTVDAPFATIQEAVIAINTVNNKDIEFTICLNGDFTLTAPLTISKNVKITKYGETAKIIRGESFTADSLIKVETGATLTIADIVIDGNNVSTTETTGGAVYVNGGTLNFSSGTIQYCVAKDGGGVYVINNGRFTMTGGTISGCTASLSGGGVWMKNGCSFEMSDGCISSCTATSEGGGVFITAGSGEEPSSFTMNGGNITLCTAQNYGGGGVSYGCGTNNSNIKFTMNGGTISNCSSSNGGGGVYLYGKLVMTGGTISDNTASNGAGVYIRHGSSSFTMEDGTISNNKAETGYGGGVYLADSSSSFTMNGGVIGQEITEDDGSKKSWEYAATETNRSNYAYAGGGGIYAKNGTVTINSGKISYNYIPGRNGSDGFWYETELAVGGGINMFAGTLTLNSGAEISYNRGYKGGGVNAGISGLNNDSSYQSTVGTCTINGAKIKGNYSGDYQCNAFGGGLMIKNFNLVCGSGETIIEENYSGDGGAVFLENTTTTFENITIRNNAYNNENGDKKGTELLLYGGAELSISSSENVIIKNDSYDIIGIFLEDKNSKLKLSGSAYLTVPVYLSYPGDDTANMATVTVSGELNPPPAANGIVATITPEEYTVGTQVLAVESDVTLAEQVGKFAVTPQITEDETTVNWTIDTDGYLELVYSDWSALKKAIDETTTTSEFVLKGDINATSTITVSNEITLKALAGTTITRGLNFTGEFFNNTSTLTLEGITLDGGNANEISIEAEAPLITSSGSLTLNNCTLQNNTNISADGGPGGVVIHNGGELIMNNGATIKNCIGGYAGGIIIYTGGTFRMNDGATISNCTSESFGGGVTVYGFDDGDSGAGGTFNMAGGTISGCTAVQGGGVYVETGTFTMSGGTIGGKTENLGCTAEQGGGVYVAANGKFEMENGSITGNTAFSTVPHGAGVDVLGIFNMSGGSITENKLICEDRSNDLSCGGAGVAVEVTKNSTNPTQIDKGGTFTMTGGTISRNEIDRKDNNTYKTNVYGTGVYVVSGANFSNNGGTISENEIYRAQ